MLRVVPSVRSARAHQLVCVAQTVESRRYASLNPLSWVRDKLRFQQRLEKMRTKAAEEGTSEESRASGRRQAKLEGKQSLFETTGVQDTKSIPTAGSVASKAKAPAVSGARPIKSKKRPPTSHEHATAVFKMSHRKLALLARQISGKPIDHAILQMQFSEKRPSTRIKNMLVTAKDHAARYKHLDQSKLIVSEAWVNKGPYLKRVEPRGRGHTGIRHHPSACMKVVLKHGKTLEEAKAAERARKLKRIASAAYVREDKPIRNPGAMWAW